MPLSSRLVNTKFFLSSLVTEIGRKGPTPATSMKDMYLQSTLAILETIDGFGCEYRCSIRS